MSSSRRNRILLDYLCGRVLRHPNPRTRESCSKPDTTPQKLPWLDSNPADLLHIFRGPSLQDAQHLLSLNTFRPPPPTRPSRPALPSSTGSRKSTASGAVLRLPLSSFITHLLIRPGLRQSINIHPDHLCSSTATAHGRASMHRQKSSVKKLRQPCSQIA